MNDEEVIADEDANSLVEYLFVTCKGDALTSLAPADALGGQRDIVMYTKGDVSAHLEDGNMLTGVVLSGGDWILFSDGVISFDAHFTLAKSVLDADILQDRAASLHRELHWNKDGMAERMWPKDDFLVDVFLVGQAPLPPHEPNGSGTWEIKFAIAGKLEAATEAPPWAKARFADLAKGAQRFKNLITNQCLAIGTLTLESREISKVTAFEFLLQPLDVGTAHEAIKEKLGKLEEARKKAQAAKDAKKKARNSKRPPRKPKKATTRPEEA